MYGVRVAFAVAPSKSARDVALAQRAAGFKKNGPARKETKRERA
jgi:hypothetical protein